MHNIIKPATASPQSHTYFPKVFKPTHTHIHIHGYMYLDISGDTRKVEGR